MIRSKNNNWGKGCVMVAIMGIIPAVIGSIVNGWAFAALWGWFNEPIKKPIKPTGVKFDYMKSKDIHPEHFGKLNRKRRRSICSQGFAQAFYEANR
ncbi:hypothetical protein LCGC14_3089910 [marine sediment metagenome]|uniref:Uncharacterized protein n=1 Tax=marine sediment metagenome TaxID=412755 RepID=A0A0F8WZJ6_9ZZZZ